MNKEQPDSQVSQKNGYAQALFTDNKPGWTDERLAGGAGEKTSIRYHDQNNVLKVANGLCHDIFFRARDVHHPDFEKIPDFSDPVDQKPLEKRPVDYRKPLDSRHKKRSYTLSKELPAPTPQRGPRASRAPSRPPRRRRRGRSR